MRDDHAPGPRVIAAWTAAAALATGVGLTATIWSTVVERSSLALEILNDLPVVGCVVVGAVIVAARPANRIGWWLLAGGVCWALGAAGIALAEYGLVHSPGAIPAAGTAAVLGQVIRGFGWNALTLAVPVYFPGGQVLNARWRWLNTALVVVFMASVLDPILDPHADLTNIGHWHNFLAPQGNWQLVSLPVFVAHIPLAAVVTVAAVVQLVQRWRTGDEYTRQQLLLFACAVAATIVAAPIGVFADGGAWVFGTTALCIPIAVGFAVLAGGLYDLRTAANRTIVWLTLSISIAALFAVVIALGSLVHGGGRATWSTWLAAGIAAALFAPLRDFLQRGVNRLMYGRWTEPYELLATLGKQLEAATDVDRLLADVVTELESLGLREVRIAVPDEHPEPVGQDELIPLSAYGSLVGTLCYRSPEVPLRPRDRRLVEDLTAHVSGVLHARMLMQDLQRARERLVLGREEERRRLRRDLHDGLGPALAGHLLRLDVIRGRLHGDEVATLVDALRADLRETVDEVRRVVEGLRPPALDELGLCGALEQAGNRLTSGSRVVADVNVGALPPLPAAVEVAAYRIGTEALANAVRHADPSRCSVAITVEAGTLVLTICDDGVGFSSGSPTGNGLHTMRERAEELRGTLTVGRAPSGRGCLVTAKIPLPVPAAVAPVVR